MSCGFGFPNGARCANITERDEQSPILLPMKSMSSVEKYLKPDVIRQIARLDLRAQFVVKGFLQGLHSSPFQGFSVEFSEHRRYSHGDDPNDIDWLVYAKTDKYYVKKFEAETNITGYLVLDLSQSMGFTYRQDLTKFEYAVSLAAALCYLMVHRSESYSIQSRYWVFTQCLSSSSMSTRSGILILVAIDERETRDRILGLLTDSPILAPPPFERVEVESLPLTEVEKRVRQCSRDSHDSGIVLVSNELVDEQTLPTCNSFVANYLLDEFSDSLLTMIAVVSEPYDRHSNLHSFERQISSEPSQAELGEAILRCMQKLAYLRKPRHALAYDPRDYEIRCINHEHQLDSYFEFRYRVYSTMCYLDADIERAPTKREIDWFDKMSVHVGLFHKQKGYKDLVGTGRLITTDRIPRQVGELVERCGGNDPILREELNKAVGVQLPVFQSQDLVHLMSKMLDLELVLGEISRVTIAQEHRGLGWSSKITNALIGLARESGVSDLLLECLPIHAHLYEKSNFRLLPGVNGKVFKIGHSMSVMGLRLSERSVFSEATWPIC